MLHKYSAIITAPLVALLLAGCAPVAPIALNSSVHDAPAPITITFGVPAVDSSRYDPLIARFNEANPDLQVRAVRLDELSPLTGEDYLRALADAADTFPLVVSRSDLVARGVVRDLAPLLDADRSGLRDDFFPGAIRPAPDGSVALLPARLSLPLLAYNRDLWVERGLPLPRPDWTWEEAGAAARALASRDGDTIATYGVMFASRTDLLRTELMDLAPLSAAPPEQLRLDDPAIVAAAEQAAALFRDGVVFTPREYPDGSRLHTEEYAPLLREGRIGIWNAGEVALDPAEPLPYTVGTATVPQGPLPTPIMPSGFAVSAGARSPEAAWRWLTFLTAQPEVAEGRPNEIPARRSVAEAVSLWERLDDEAAMAVRATLANQEAPMASSRSAVSWPVRQAFGGALAAILDEGQRPEAALRAAQMLLDARLAEQR